MPTEVEVAAVHKALRNVEIKDAAKGHVTAVFATLGVVDKDGDVTVKGAFKEGAKVAISAYNHKSWEGALPVGKGTIHEVGNEVVLDGQFFLNTTHGRDAFETIKALSEDGPGTEWSYGFDVEDSEVPTQKMADNHRRTLKRMKVHEVSPVMVGAGVGTRVTGMKKTFAEQLKDVVASVKAASERAADVMAMRAEKGKGLGEESLTLLTELKDELEALLKSAETKSEETVTDENLESANAELRAAYLRFIRDNT
jgi:hypothetical protein